MKNSRLRFLSRKSDRKASHSVLQPLRFRRGFTLLQVIVTISIIAVLAATLFGVMGSGKTTARRAQCDTRLKAIALALDAFKQENGKFPKTLKALQADKYLREPGALQCPDDPRKDAAGYEEFYVVRASRDADDMPLVVCPFHEEQGATGMQAFKGRYTAQHPTRPARLTAARNAMIQRPGKAAIAAAAGMELRGGDRIITGGTPPAGATGGTVGGATGTGGGALNNLAKANGNMDGGEAVIEFADGSTATLSSGTTATVLQSFLMGQSNAPLYTLIRQGVGQAIYKVHSGSKFDVVTPTATSGARGTEFTITVTKNGETQLTVTEGKVAFTTLTQTVIAPLGQTVSGLLNGIIKLL